MPPFLKRWYWHCWKCGDIYAQHYTLNILESSGKFLDRIFGTKLGPRINDARHDASFDHTFNKTPFTLRSVLRNLKHPRSTTP